MSILRKSTIDTLEGKRADLATYTQIFENSVSVITGIIDTMDKMSSNISSTIQEIEDYQAALEETKTGLINAKDRNSRVIQNFKSLLEIE